MIVGDIHFSDVYKGKHKNYLSECYWTLDKISEKLEAAKPAALVLLGDVIGWSETNIHSREVLASFMRVLKKWNEYCPVYSVRGNHDIKGYPDFQLFSELGLIITSEMSDGYFDYFADQNTDIPLVRFHIVDYGSENKILHCAEAPTNNIVLGHNNYTINGVTNWYMEHDGIELNLQQNYNQVDMVISGHIHNPSPEICSTQMPSGKECMLFYPGCPTRPIKDKCIYENCWYVFIEYNATTGQVDILPEEFKLKPLKDVFFDDSLFVDEQTEEVQEEMARKEALMDILKDLMTFRMNGGDPFEQIEKIPDATVEAKAMAKKYMEMAYNA